LIQLEVRQPTKLEATPLRVPTMVQAPVATRVVRQVGVIIIISSSSSLRAFMNHLPMLVIHIALGCAFPVEFLSIAMSVVHQCIYFVVGLCFSCSALLLLLSMTMVSLPL
jgi:hypothetical protein